MAKPKLIDISLEDLRESAHNVRHRLDGERMQNLVESIQAKGILTPLLVRPVNEHYEIAGGHRRFVAAGKAGLKVVPAIVREMDDLEFLEVMVIDNDQREDVHPLEEAKGYEALMKTGDYDVAKVATSVSRSQSYVYDRLRLLQLTKEAQQLFWDDNINVAHAVILARLSSDDQARAIEEGLFQRENLSGILSLDESAELEPRKAVSVRELQGWVNRHVRFDKLDETVPQLFPETAKAMESALAEDLKVISITYENHVQPEAKDEAERTFGPLTWKRADVETCEHAVMGVVVTGPGRGEAFLVCTDKKKCATHWQDEIRESEKRAKAKPESAKKEKSTVEAERREREEQQRRAEVERARWQKATPHILQALASAIRKASASSVGIIADTLVKSSFQSCPGSEASVAKFVPRGKTSEDLVRFLFMIYVMRNVGVYQASENLPRFGKMLGVDVTAILNEFAPIEKPAKAVKPKKAGKKK